LDEKKWESNQVIVERGGQTVYAGELFTATVGIPVVEPPEGANRVNL
jgi:hypothetical protein